MKHEAKTHQTRGLILRPLLAVLLTLGGVALLAQASSPSGAGSQTTKTVATTPGVPRFLNYYSPPGIGDSTGEPSIGSNWKTEKKFSNSLFEIPNGGTCLYYGGLELAGTPLLRITFNDCSSPASALWEVKLPPLNQTPRAAGDPILFTDHDTGRTFISQLEGLTPAGSSTDITDDDGETFMPSEGSSLPSDIDHQTFGGGIFHDGGLGPITDYPHAVYYASQSVADARAALSVDGGVTFGPGFPMYTIDECAGLHGHIKVSPKDGTVYVPNRGCGGATPFHETGARQAVAVSEDNGMTWDVRPIPDATTHGSGNEQNTFLATRDPSVAIDADGTVYFVYQAEDRLTEYTTDPADKAGNTHPKVAVSHDKGLHWAPSVDVGANVINGGPIKNATFVAATAGSSGRAAVAFFGTETGGNNWACGEGDDCSGDTGLFPRDPFTGIWYLYVSVTYDGGKTWTTQNVTPGDPIQRGGICGGGTCRNLLDFMDIQIDKEGRILVAGEDGCIGPCVNGPPNSFTAKAFITRQSGGKRLLAAFDPVEPVLPGAPTLTGSINAAKTIASLAWTPPDNGGSTITSYNVYRRAGTAGSFTLLANVTETNYTDTTFNKTVKNFYRVTANNAEGEGPFCKEFTPAVVELPNPCATPGVLAVNDVNSDGSDADAAPNLPPDPSVNIRQLFVAEPFFGPGVNKLVFTLQVAPSESAPPPSSQWFIIWNRLHPDADFDRFYVAMRTDASGTPSFEYGKFGVALDATNPNPNANTPVKVGDADAGTYDPATGLIKITLSNSKAENIHANQGLAGLNVRTYFARPDPGQRSQNNASDITADSSYTLAGNAACALNRPPTAVLTATPKVGNPPLLVNFNASGSVDPDAGDSVASYTFSFGDGSPNVTQSSPTISHTYKHGGGFFATLSVTDSHGTKSANVASVPIKVAAQVLNLSTRLRVEPGDKALIGGLIILGSEKKKVVLRGIGPSLKNNGAPLPGRLQDPVIELHNKSGVVIASNDDWTSHRAEVEATGLAPTDSHESAIVITLDPGSYTVVMRGKNNGSGIGVVETYDIGLAANARLGNLSSRGVIGNGDDVLIGGFFTGPQTASSTRGVLRAIGPSLTAFGVPDAMQDPTIELRNRNGELLAQNDDWQQSPRKAELQATGLQPKDNRESAIVITDFEPGPYTAIVRGKNGETGVGLVEIFDVQK